MQYSFLFKTLAENMADGMYIVDKNRTIVFWNKAASQISGYLPEEVLGICCQNTSLNHIDTSGTPLCSMSCPLHATICDGASRQADVLLRHKNGHRVPIRVSAIPLFENGKIEGAIEIFRPYPAHYEGQFVEALASHAIKDPLTGLPNRSYLENFISFKLMEHRRFNNLFCVLFADVDNFTALNDTYGHSAGDVFLCAIAEALVSSLRPSDKIGRWGGEEFLGIFDLRSEQDTFTIGEKVRKTVEDLRPHYNGAYLQATISVGVTLVQPGDSIRTIITRSDKLMYQSKTKGKNRTSTDSIR